MLCFLTSCVAPSEVGGILIMLFLEGNDDVDFKSHAPSEVVSVVGTTGVGSAVSICFIFGVVSR